mmetsp:Transcript_89995/g.173206  ORF Transcript_89995/g.173206 Transcript_89995/m.173206 type:complete len:220 (+) Transcript_89995:632-1291(+)
MRLGSGWCVGKDGRTEAAREWDGYPTKVQISSSLCQPFPIHYRPRCLAWHYMHGCLVSPQAKSTSLACCRSLSPSIAHRPARGLRHVGLHRRLAHSQKIAQVVSPQKWNPRAVYLDQLLESLSCNGTKREAHSNHTAPHCQSLGLGPLLPAWICPRREHGWLKYDQPQKDLSATFALQKLLYMILLSAPQAVELLCCYDRPLNLSTALLALPHGQSFCD